MPKTRKSGSGFKAMKKILRPMALKEAGAEVPRRFTIGASYDVARRRRQRPWLPTPDSPQMLSSGWAVVSLGLTPMLLSFGACMGFPSLSASGQKISTWSILTTFPKHVVSNDTRRVPFAWADGLCRFNGAVTCLIARLDMWVRHSIVTA